MNEQTTRRLPAEWEPQDGVLISWPHVESDWRPFLAEVEPVFIDIARAVSRFERVLILATDVRSLQERLRRADLVLERIEIFQIATNDTWVRDFGPITVLDGGRPLLLDFCFNGWGLKFPACRDNRAGRGLHRAGAFGATPMETLGLTLEGGSIDSDGRGSLLTTAACLLEPNRNPHLSRGEITTTLTGFLGTDHFLWLNHGFLAGDDTDSHIDTLARLGPDDTILYVCCDDPDDPHYEELQAMAEELASFKTRDGRPYRLLPLPWPSPCHDENGDRLPATYANFLVINGAVLVPTYHDSKDLIALATVKKAFPDREIVGIHCLPLIRQHGSLHCVTMQIPTGVLP
ncbi:MAG: agmatine deiminase family protein [Desulfocapsaceae bacterium]|nr:agmatine deiminase family protein [Desulfocapsaceae bacterium]